MILSDLTKITSSKDKSKNITSKQVIEDRNSNTYKESFVSLGPETETDDNSSIENYASSDVDEIDEMMTDIPVQNNNVLQNVIQQIKSKQHAAKESVLSGGSPAKNSFTRAG